MLVIHTQLIFYPNSICTDRCIIEFTCYICVSMQCYSVMQSIHVHPEFTHQFVVLQLAQQYSTHYMIRTYLNMYMYVCICINLLIIMLSAHIRRHVPRFIEGKA